MGGDAQLDNIIKTVNGSDFDKATVVNRPQNFSKTVERMKTAR